MNAQDIINILKLYFSEKSEIEFSYLFGSYSVNKNNKLSDIDIAVYINENIQSKLEIYYKSEIISKLMSLLKKNEIDLVILNYAPILLKHRVLRTGTLIESKNEKARICFETNTLKNYLDTKRIRDIENQYFVKRIKNAG